jgi:hypothetical protein
LSRGHFGVLAYQNRPLFSRVEEPLFRPHTRARAAPLTPAHPAQVTCGCWGEEEVESAQFCNLGESGATLTCASNFVSFQASKLKTGDQDGVINTKVSACQPVSLLQSCNFPAHVVVASCSENSSKLESHGTKNIRWHGIHVTAGCTLNI